MAQKPTSTGPSQRQQRVAELVRHALAEVLQRGDIQDPVLNTHVVTVPEVRMSPDLKLATAYVMPLGGMDEAPVIATAFPLSSAIRRRILALGRYECGLERLGARVGGEGVERAGDGVDERGTEEGERPQVAHLAERLLLGDIGKADQVAEQQKRADP